jgi:hypothetical protein
MTAKVAIVSWEDGICLSEVLKLACEISIWLGE